MSEFNPFAHTEVFDHAITLHKQMLRDKLAQAVKAARNYDGTEQSYNELFEELIDFEKRLQSFRISNTESAEDFEQEMLRRMGVKHKNLTVNGLLEMAASKFQSQMENNTNDTSNLNTEKKLPANIYKIQLNGIILIPDQKPEMANENSRHQKAERRSRPRLQALIALLNRNNIFTDDLVIYTGKTDPDMKRKVSYDILEIPRLNKSILLCDEVGEATFIIHSNLDPESFLSITKDDLLKKHPETTRITETDQESWEEKILEALLRDPKGHNIQPGIKIDIATRESVRSLITDQYTPEHFLNLTTTEKRTLKIAGRKYSAIASLFGISYRAIGKTTLHFQLAKAIYGNDNLAVKKALLETAENEKIQHTLGKDPLLWAEHIKSLFPNPKFLLNLPRIERRKLKISGVSLFTLATILNIQGNPRENNSFFYELLKKIYGNDNDEINKALEIQRQREQSIEAGQISKEEVAKIIQEEYPNSDDFVSAVEKQQRSFSINGISLYRIGLKFGISERANENYMGRFRLIREIYGADDPWILKHTPEYQEKLKQLQLAELTAEDYKRLVITEYPTADHLLELLEINARERRMVKINGLGFTAIASKLGISANPLYSTKNFLMFAQAIYGSDIPSINQKLDAILEREKLEKDFTDNPGKLITLIKQRYPTKTDFINLDRHGGESYKISGFGILTMAKILKIPSGRTVDKNVINAIADKIYD